MESGALVLECWRGEGLTIKMRWGRGRGRGEVDDNNNDCWWGGATRAKIGEKGWQGDEDGDDCGRGSQVFVAHSSSDSHNEVCTRQVGLHGEALTPELPVHHQKLW